MAVLFGALKINHRSLPLVPGLPFQRKISMLSLFAIPGKRRIQVHARVAGLLYLIIILISIKNIMSASGSPEAAAMLRKSSLDRLSSSVMSEQKARRLSSSVRVACRTCGFDPLLLSE
jgi:hypothetical protein